jgi:hypothetical protein
LVLTANARSQSSSVLFVNRHARRRRHAGVVHEHVDVTQLLARAIDHRLDVGGAGHVAFHGQHPAAQRLDLLRDLLRIEDVQVRDGDVRARLRHREHDAAPDPAASARDDRHLARKPHGISL